MHKTLNDLPLEMRETNKPTLYPYSMIVDLLIKLDDRDYYIAHADQSLSLVDNIKNMLTILSDNRISFTKEANNHDSDCPANDGQPCAEWCNLFK